MPNPMRAKAAIPPRTPPTMAPTGVGFLGLGAGEDVVGEGVIEEIVDVETGVGDTEVTEDPGVLVAS